MTDMPEQEIETDYNSQGVCPYCGHEHDTSWEWFRGDDGDGSKTIVSCAKCGEDFEVTMNIDITYSTRKLEDE